MKFVDQKRRALYALSACQLTAFHRECLVARELFKNLKSENARCKTIYEKNKDKMHELSCEVIQIPNNCQ
jgi:hypothetical protein